jgi:hypothetical protein
MPNLTRSSALFALLACGSTPPATNDPPTDPSADCPVDDPGRRTYFRDADGDGFGDARDTTSACAAPEGYAAQAGDCDDGDPTVHPGAPDDQCNGVDNDCDGTADSDAPIVTIYPDDDDDGFGRTEGARQACLPAPGFTTAPDDCDDDDPEVYPGAPQLCDGKDNACTGIVDDGLWGEGEACPATSCQFLRDNAPSVPPGRYWIAADDGPFEATCAFYGPVGFTMIPGALLRERGWVRFDVTAGSRDGHTLAWDGDAIVLAQPLTSAMPPPGTCAYAAIRATATMPFAFDAARADFTTTFSGDDTHDLDWGTVPLDGPAQCAGAVLFGIDDEPKLKRGGTWGRPVDYVIRGSHEAGPGSGARRAFRWEINSIPNVDPRRSRLRIDDILLQIQ